jgi:hypothetical protein
MTISSTNRKAGPFAGNDVTVDFPFAFKVFDVDDVLVVFTSLLTVESTLEIGTDYSVSLNSNQDSNPGGTVTLVSALATGTKLTLTSSVAELQPVTLTNQGGFYPKVINNALDRATIQIQQLKEKLSRALVWPISFSGATLPIPEASKFIGWNATADSLVNLDGVAVGDAQTVSFTQAGIGSVTRSVQDKERDLVSVKDKGVVGNGSDETTNLQNALDTAAGSVLILEGGKTYGYSSLTIKEGTTIISNGATFNRLAASTTHGITIESGVTIDSLVITTPGGSSGDKGVAIRGANVTIGRLSVTATAQGAYNSTNYALEIESNPSGSNLSNITIDSFYCKYFSAGIFAKNVSALNVGNALVEYYRTAFYLRDVSNSDFSNVLCRYTASTSYGTNGENGLLLESTLASGSCHDLSFNGWSVNNSGEHAYRLGGALAIRNVWFNNCHAKDSGSSIVVNNPAATEWHGGCGFKVLGGTAVDNERHENIYFNSCVVNDVNQTFGTFPGGHGVNNFTPWLIIAANNVHLDNCSIDTVSATYSARHGILVTACDGLFINDASFRGLKDSAIRPYEETPIGGFPYQDRPVVNLVVNGGLFEITNPTDGIQFYFAENAAYAHRNWRVSGAVFKGGLAAVRLETVAAGSFTNVSMDFTHQDANVTDSTYTAPAVVGGAYALLRVTAPWRPLAYDPSALNGSTWQEPSGTMREKTIGTWRATRPTYSIVVADDSFTTIVPPSDLDPGFLMIAGSGTTKHMMAWYRASSSPASSKYAGAAATVIVNTALTGTTGTDGNITVGVQEDLIYIENRGGSSDTFIITFL